MSCLYVITLYDVLYYAALSAVFLALTHVNSTQCSPVYTKIQNFVECKEWILWLMGLCKHAIVIVCLLVYNVVIFLLYSTDFLISVCFIHVRWLTCKCKHYRFVVALVNDQCLLTSLQVKAGCLQFLFKLTTRHQRKPKGTLSIKIWYESHMSDKYHIKRQIYGFPGGCPEMWYSDGLAAHQPIRCLVHVGTGSSLLLGEISGHRE